MEKPLYVATCVSFFDSQEEIRFCMSPELLCSMLLFEAMDDNEAILIEGFETYSAHKGYARTFQFEGNLQDTALVRLLCSAHCVLQKNASGLCE